MQRYFFHVKDGKEIIDQVGTELAGDDEARDEAIVVSGEMLRGVGREFWNNGEWRLWVVDQAGRTVCALRFSAEHASADLGPGLIPVADGGRDADGGEEVRREPIVAGGDAAEGL